MAVQTNGRPISRDDLEDAFSKVLGEGEATAESAQRPVLVVAAAVAIGVVALAYLAGRRRGRKRATVIELRRILTMDRLLWRLVRTSLRRGVGGEHWSWFALSLAAFVLRRALQPDRRRVITVPVRPGERYLVTTSDPRRRS